MSVTHFTITLPTHSVQESQKFYLQTIKAELIQKNQTCLRFNFFDHSLNLYFLGEEFKPQQHCNHVDKHDVPVPHFGVVLSVQSFKQLSERLTAAKVHFIIEPHLRFEGLVGEQWTMFFKDPTGNNLEFKALTNPDFLFAK